METPMPTPAGPRRGMTFEEYIAFEEAATTRHELVAGELYAMSGAARRHSTIAGNLHIRLRLASAGGPCLVYQEGVKLQVARDTVYYPDVVVTCDPTDDDEYIVRTPCLVVEVTSRSTAATDRREKSAAYRAMPSVRAYLIVDQRRRRVDRHWRDDLGDWWHETIIAGEVAVPCPATTLSLDAIYEGITFDAVSEPDPPEWDSAVAYQSAP